MRKKMAVSTSRGILGESFSMRVSIVQLRCSFFEIDYPRRRPTGMGFTPHTACEFVPYCLT
jgi:hypothetical protein